MSELANAINAENDNLQNNNSSNNGNRRTLSVTDKTFKRLAKHGKWNESADDLINRILSEREKRETSDRERSF
jgi:CRISPR/Cas system-associated protein endoribonuclease Cas2